ncbi:MAG: archease, partial [Anaerolineales bacterium]
DLSRTNSLHPLSEGFIPNSLAPYLPIAPQAIHLFSVYVILKLMQANAGFQEIEHTADIALRVWAASIPELLEQAAKGMFTICGVQVNQQSRHQRTFQISFSDYETLLVHFLSELLYYLEKDNLALERFRISISEAQVKVTAHGHPVQSIQKMIKAVTYHKLEVQVREHGYEAQIVFDI